MTGLHVHEVLVEDPETAAVSSRAMSVQHIEHVVRTPDVAEVLSYAPAEIHSSIASTMYDNDLVGRRTPSPEVLGLADDIIGQVCDIPANR